MESEGSQFILQNLINDLR